MTMTKYSNVDVVLRMRELNSSVRVVTCNDDEDEDESDVPWSRI